MRFPLTHNSIFLGDESTGDRCRQFSLNVFTLRVQWKDKKRCKSSGLRYSIQRRLLSRRTVNTRESMQTVICLYHSKESVKFDFCVHMDIEPSAANEY